MGKSKTHEEYVKELKIKNPTLEVVGKYINANTKITHHCLIHNVYWDAVPSSLLRGCGCYKCKSERIRSSKVKPESSYIDEVKKANPQIEVIGQYIDSNTPILHRCKLHNITWNAYPASILRGCGCYKCGIDKSKNGRTKHHDDYIDELGNFNPNIIVLGEYINASTPILHKCAIDGYEWYARPANILSGKGCPKCGGNILKPHEEYVREVKKINPYIIVKEKYVNANTSILHECKIDHHIWKARPDDILHDRGCPLCNESRLERKTRIWLENHSFSYIKDKKYDDCIDKRSLSYDFYLPDYNTNIECQGRQHYEPVDYFGGEEQFSVQLLHDKIKRDYCTSNGIKLLEIPYNANVEETLNNFLLN